MEKRNSGVDRRNERDEEESEKAEITQDEIEAKLNAKAIIYDKLVAGKISEVPDNYNVDFELKNYGGSDQIPIYSDEYNPGGKGGESQQSKRQKKEEKIETDPFAQEEVLEHEKRQRRKLFDQLQRQTEMGRQKHIELKRRREKADQERRKLIKNKEKDAAKSGDILAQIQEFK
eukprot:TRINITY_DN4753_c0_g1_i1.p2 TRINITY_DN4753_c0_g1~~TRINITY_DN4753_c0_g1_i1.p2  ORF type:complete len:174 (-),score=72.67 TRINITY_DN4753_c0_g1_i1:85-606(-)